MRLDPPSALSITRACESTAGNTFRLVPDPPMFVRGEGPWLLDADGRRYLDLVCGSATTNLGHAHPAHLAALREVFASGILHTGTRLASVFRAELYKRLCGVLPAQLHCFHLANSGAEAMEAAIKAAQFATGRRRLIAFEGGYHGRTIGALSITHSERIRAPFSTLESLVDFLPYPGTESSAEAGLAALDDRLSALRRENGLPAAIVIEAVQAVSGVIGPNVDFLRGVRDLSSRHDVPLVLDEIWNGFGRTGRWFGFQHAGIEPDMVVMGKGLSAGLPLSGVAAGERFLKAWPPGMHTSTFQGNPAACAMAVATIDVISRDNLLSHVSSVVAPAMETALAALLGLPGIAAVRVAGAQAAIQFHRDGVPDGERSANLQRRLLREDLLVYGGGRQSDCLMLLPPINLGLEILNPALTRIVEAVSSEP